MYCGVDMSADTFDICVAKPEGNFAWHQLPNNNKGFKQLLKLCPANFHFVMETTGVFHLPLCFFLHEKKCAYSVVNALKIKRRLAYLYVRY
jgi:transposase